MSKQVTVETDADNNAKTPGASQEKNGWGNQLRTNTSLRRGATLLFALGAILVLAALVVSYDYYTIRESTDDAQIDGHIDPISARVGGTVEAVKIQENQYVEKGTLLVQLDPKDYQVALDRAKANLAEAEAAAKAAGTEIPLTSTTTSNQIDSSQAALTKAQSGIVVAAREVDSARARLALMKARERAPACSPLKMPRGTM